MRVVVIVVFCLISLAQCNQPPYFMMLLGPIPVFVRMFSEKAIEGCPEYAGNYSIATHESAACSRSSNASFRTLCNEFQKNVERCSKPVINFYAECLPEKSRDLPQIIIKGFVSLNKFMCEKKDNLEIEEGFQDLCIPYALTELYQESKCLKTLIKKAEKLASDMPTKSEGCQFVNELRTCMQESVDNKCHSSGPRNAYSQFLNAAFSECGKKNTLDES